VKGAERERESYLTLSGIIPSWIRAF